MNHQFMPYRWADGEVDYLTGIEERPSKRHRGEPSDLILELPFHSVPVTWRVSIHHVTMPNVRQIVLYNPLFSHLSKVDTGPSSPVPVEQFYAGDDGAWELGVGVDVGCPSYNVHLRFPMRFPTLAILWKS